MIGILETQKRPQVAVPEGLAAAEATPVSAAGHRPSLRANIAALAMLQASSYVIPVAITAYTARVLGVEAWGKVALVQLVLSYFTLVVGWGFSWSATRKIAAVQDDRAAVSAIAAPTVAIQGVLALLMAMLLLMLVAFVPF